MVFKVNLNKFKNHSPSFNEIKESYKFILLENNKNNKTNKTMESKRIFKAIKSMFVSNGLTILLQLLMVPLLIYSWGVDLYGEWLILYTIPGYIILSDFGIITTANNKIDALCAKNKFLSANKVYYNSNILLFLIMILIVFIMIIVGFFLSEKIFRIFNILTEHEIILSVIILMADAFVSLFHNHNSALYRTLKKFEITINWQAVGRVVPLLVLIFLAAYTKELFIPILFMFLSRIFIFFVMVFNLKKKVFWIKNTLFKYDKKEVHGLSITAMNYMLIPIANMIYLQGSIIAIASLFSPIIVASYSTLRTFTRLMPQFVGIIGRSRWSEISYNNAQKNYKKIYEMKRKVVAQTIFFSLAISIIYILFGEFFYKIWVGFGVGFDKFLFLSLVVNSLMITWYYSIEVFILAINKMKTYSIIFFISSVLQILLGILFVKHMGISSFPIVSAFLSFFVFIYLIIEIKKEVI